MKISGAWGLFLFLLILLTTSAGFCEAPEKNFDGTEALIEILKDKGVLSDEEAAAFIERYQKQTGEAERQAENKPVVSIIPEGREAEYMDKFTDDVAKKIRKRVTARVKSELRDELGKEMELTRSTLAVPGWVQRIRWGGDIRLRHQSDFFDENNAILVKPDAPDEALNTRNDRQRQRVRIRVGMKAQVTEPTEVGVRLASGSEKDPVSTNETLGDYQNKDGFVLDQAYLKYSPIPEFSVWGGRMPNPFYTTDLVWDGDISFEGLAITTGSPEHKSFGGFLNAGIFPLQEVELSQQDKWMYGAQVGVQYRPRADLIFRVAAAYYDFQNIQGQVNDPLRPGEKDWTAPLFQQKGNTLVDINEELGADRLLALAADYNELHLNTYLDIAFYYPIHVILTADYVRNIGFDKDEVSRIVNADVPEDVEGYRFGLTVGHASVKSWGDWQVRLLYKYLEADAVIDAFTDSDFHQGGTNAQGWVLGGQMGITKNLWLASQWMSTDEISGPQFAVDTLQVDLSTKF